MLDFSGTETLHEEQRALQAFRVAIAYLLLAPSSSMRPVTQVLLGDQAQAYRHSQVRALAQRQFGAYWVLCGWQALAHQC